MFPDPRSQKSSLCWQFIRALCLSLLFTLMVCAFVGAKLSNFISHAVVAEIEIAAAEFDFLFQQTFHQHPWHVWDAYLLTEFPILSMGCCGTDFDRLPSAWRTKRFFRTTFPRSSLEDTSARRL